MENTLPFANIICFKFMLFKIETIFQTYASGLAKFK